ncbi:hypothetical protein [Rhodopirellula sp. MGV]|uniref:hypothetical protein n=1 Tax=Rhodopirellula sp. MGV TaxID=2023130 RepID=UPI000B96566C|nr:hypothetical protein [Rhodopirellula sp. MGV]OYP38853.1 hypothetical protein CGZ80_01135 [Rhodopirellula sp. MGV]PNY37662.1 hypothetical protein C2E31_06865 [Rhodopirellula baltica]
MKKYIASAFAVLFVAAATVVAGEVNLEGVKCVIAPRAAKADKSADYKEGKVYFCCDNCAGKFAKDSKPFTEKANLQLVSTHQYEQKACPLSGGDIDESTAVKIEGTKVAFCCNNCKGKVEGEKDDAAKLKLVYSDKAFKNGFAKVEPKKE